MRRGAGAGAVATSRSARRRACRGCRSARRRTVVVEASRGCLMDTITKVAAFLVVLGVLVVFHELGHYVVARWCRVKVLRFSVGFGRVLWSRRFGPDGTEWALSAIPLGGYVKMVDEREGAVPSADLPRAFN